MRRVTLAVCLLLFSSSVVGAQDRDVRRLAAGVLKVIPTDPLEGETISGPLPLVELTVGRKDLAWKPVPNLTEVSNTLLHKAARVTLRRAIWNLEFAFKPMRMIEVDVPQPSGKMQRKKLWYLVYRVKYSGNELTPKAVKDPKWELSTFPTTGSVSNPGRRFFPQLVLRSHEHKKSYLDRVIPAAKLPILQREFPSKKPGKTTLTPEELHNSVQIFSRTIPLSTERIDRSVWGFATWQDVDPRTDYVSVYVNGLTNAFRFQDPDGAYKAGDKPGTGRTFAFKTLQLNFWRPGDTEMENEEEIRYGIPVEEMPAEQKRVFGLYGVKERVDHLWIYR